MKGAGRRIWLVRHGESDANVGRIDAGSDSVALTERGTLQVDALAALLDARLDKIVVSPLLRARQTAAAISRRHPGIELDCWPIQEFEIRPSLLHGSDVPRSDSDRASADYWSTACPSALSGPGAESFEQFIRRVAASIDRLRDDPAQAIAFVSHRKFLSALVWVLMTGSAATSSRRMRRYRDFDLGFRIPNAAVIPLVWTPEGPMLGPLRRSACDAR